MPTCTAKFEPPLRSKILYAAIVTRNKWKCEVRSGAHGESNETRPSNLTWREMPFLRLRPSMRTHTCSIINQLSREYIYLFRECVENHLVWFLSKLYGTCAHLNPLPLAFEAMGNSCPIAKISNILWTKLVLLAGEEFSWAPKTSKLLQWGMLVSANLPLVLRVNAFECTARYY